MGVKAGVGLVGGAAAGFLIGGPLGALIVGALIGAIGLAADETSEAARKREELEKLDPNSSAGEIASTLKRAGRDSFVHTHEREVEVDGERVTERHTREIRRNS